MRYFLFILLVLMMLSCQHRNTLFIKKSASHTGIRFNNKITENDSINPLDMEFLYNGGGVAVGDFNNDSLPDLYFTASQVANRMYLNKGNFNFSDITQTAGVEGKGRWSNAASVVDINNDGWLDIYVCATISKDPGRRENLLYINQGLDPEGTPHFKEMARAYNLADTGLSVHAAFFDYDRDGDLDMYLVNTNLAQRNSTRFDGGSDENKEALSDKLYRNDYNNALGHPYFVDVSKEAGILDEGYGLGLAIADINKDGWKDIYVTNDFFGSDLFYINNGDGTFTDRARTVFKHTSQNAMGNDIADINNDGYDDIIAVDMNPEDNFRKKKNMNGSNYFVYQSMINSGLVLQYVRNTLQLNNGILAMDSSGPRLPSFSDISFYAGVAETDWSWNPSLADFDNDGFKDLVITNGYPRDVTDHDFAVFRTQAYQAASKASLLQQIPQVKIPNYAFRNNGALGFEQVTESWGMQTPSFSCGAAYADLDGDGDLDYVINNIDDEAFVYENRSLEVNGNNFLNIRFAGNNHNKNGIGAVATIFYNNQQQRFENSPYRGYLSTVDAALHFGLGKVATIDSIIVEWPDGKEQRLLQVPANQTLIVQHAEAAFPAQQLMEMTPPLFINTTPQHGINFRHFETDFIDFNYQKLLPHKLSQYGPALAVGDVNSDGLDDLVVGAPAGNYGQVLLQRPGGSFVQKALPVATGPGARRPEMMGMLLFDADSDGDLDLYACSGSNEFTAGTKDYQDQFFRNDGKGSFALDTSALPPNYTSKSCLKAADFDGDGDLDLFIGGRVLPEQYPRPVSSFIYRNDSENGKIKFTDVTRQVAPFLENFGLVCDATWTDFDNDGWQDLILTGEWMPITFIRNNQGQFTNITSTTGLSGHVGWWSGITSGDFDNDGDMDYVVGNLGLNSFFKASKAEPVRLYAADFDGDQSYDAIPTLFLPGKDGKRKEFPAHVRDDMAKQMIGIKRRFQNYKSFADAEMNMILSSEEMSLAQVHEANFFASCYLQNNGNNRFEFKPLPPAAQMAPLNGMVAEDLNHDGFLDVVVIGNDFGNEVVNGRYDALNGLVLLGNGKGGFTPAGLEQSGIFVPGDGKALAKLAIGNTYALAATQNQGNLQVFSHPAASGILRFQKDDVWALIHHTNGTTRRYEVGYGSSFLSQSARFLLLNPSIASVEITNSKGIKRQAVLNK